LFRSLFHYAKFSLFVSASLRRDLIAHALLNPYFFLNLEKWNHYSGNSHENAHVISGGDESTKTAWGMLHSWDSIDDTGNG
jgi:hypothetical protein